MSLRGFSVLNSIFSYSARLAPQWIHEHVYVPDVFRHFASIFLCDDSRRILRSMNTSMKDGLTPRRSNCWSETLPFSGTAVPAHRPTGFKAELHHCWRQTPLLSGSAVPRL